MTKIPFFRVREDKGEDVYFSVLNIATITVQGDRGMEQAVIKLLDGIRFKLNTSEWVSFRRANADYLMGLPRDF